MELLKSGLTPTVSDIAEAAEVSRRTVYLHFPTLEQLLIDAKVGLLCGSAIDDAIEAADTEGKPEARVAAMIGALSAKVSETLPLGRSMIRLTVDAPDSAEMNAPRRGYRRIGWIEKAVSPLRQVLEHGEFERLVSALAMVTGWEAFVVLQDIRGLSPDEQRETSLWAARALIQASLNKTRPPREEPRK
jgi:AcrR family transcriptional regulator